MRHRWPGRCQRRNGQIREGSRAGSRRRSRPARNRHSTISGSTGTERATGATKRGRSRRQVVAVVPNGDTKGGPPGCRTSRNRFAVDATPEGKGFSNPKLEPMHFRRGNRRSVGRKDGKSEIGRRARTRRHQPFWLGRGSLIAGDSRGGGARPTDAASILTSRCHKSAGNHGPGKFTARC
jgi:hypothetical protein